MYQINKKEWDRLKREHPDYVCRNFYQHEHNGKISKKGDWSCFEYLLSRNPEHGTSLIFEHIHFEIV